MKNNLKIIFPLFALIATISGCSIFSPIGDGIATGYQSFVGYFNTYYNATSAFKLGEESVQNYYNNPKNTYPTLDKLRQVTFSEVPADAKMNFDKVIEKGSKILNSYNRSVLVDDALLLIGKSYFYSLEYTRAERKFLELLSQYPESDLIPEAKIWCAKTFLKNRKEEDAKLLLRDVIELGKKEEENDLISQSNIILSDYYLSKTDTSDALKYYLDALKYTEDKETAAQINFRLGEIFEKQDSLLLASDYFFKSADLASKMAIRYWGMNKYGTIQKKFGKYDLAEKIFKDLESNPQLREFLPYTYYEIAELKMKTNRMDEAIELFNMLDTTYAKTEPSAKGYFQMGMISETIYKDYKKAKEFYQKSKESLNNISITPITDDKIKRLENFLSADRLAFLSDSLFILANVPDTAIVYNFDINVSSKIKDSSALFMKMREDTGTIKFVTADSANRLKRDTIITNLIKKDSVLVKDTIVLIVKNHIDTIKSTEGTILRTQNYHSKYNIMSDKVDTIIVSELSRILSIDSTRLKTATKDLAAKKNALAIAWLKEMNRSDTARAIFEEILYKFPKDENYYPEMIFSLSTAYDKDSIKKEQSDSLLKVLIDKYPTHPSVFEAKMRLGIKIVEKIDTAKILYSKADSLFESQKIDEAIKGYEDVIKKHPTSNWASKSLYAIGWIIENKKNDSKEAIKRYRKLLEDYPSSSYAALVKAKIDTVEKYYPSKPKIDKKDSLKVADSLKVKQNLPSVKVASPAPDTVSHQEKIKLEPPTGEIKLDKQPKVDSAQTRRRREIE